MVLAGWPAKGGSMGVVWSLAAGGPPPPEVVEASEAMEAHGLAGGVVADAKIAVLVLAWFWSAVAWGAGMGGTEA